MTKLSYKALLIILAFLLIPIILLIQANKKTRIVEASWFNDSWHYRNNIQITNNTTEESNVYTTLSIGTSSLINNGKLQANCADLRFTNQQGDPLLYYISSGCGTTATSINVNHNTFPAGDQTIYFYYGNPNANGGTQSSNFSTEASNYSIGSTASEEISGGPIAYWKFDEGIGTTINDSAGTNTGNLGTGDSAPTWVTEESCINEKCLQFDGNDFISLPNELVKTSNIRNQGISYSIWIKPTSISSTYNIFGQKPSAGYSNFASGGLGISNNKARMIAYDDGIAYKFATGNTTLENNQWYYLTGTYDSSDQKIRIYVNGKLDATPISIITFNRLVANNTNTIGYQIHATSPNFFDGFIDEVKIYPYALTSDEILKEYNLNTSALIGQNSETAQITPLKSKLIGHWKFDEGYGNTLNNSGNTNSSLNATFGTGNSAPTWINNGKFGKALSFDGTSDYAVASLSQITDFPFTLSIWAKYTGSGNDTLYTLNSSTDTSKFYSLWVNTSLLLKLGARNGVNADASSTTPLDQNWHYLTAVFESSTDRRLYIDGKLAATSTTEVTFNSGIDQVRIGNCGTCCYTSGFLDEAKLYNYALSEDEILLDYNQGKTLVIGQSTSDSGSTAPAGSASQKYCIPGDSSSTCRPPIGQWNFEKGVGATAYDISGNQNPAIFGTSTASPLWTQGKIGKGLSFDGDDDYALVSSFTEITSYPFTLSVWTKYAGGGNDTFFSLASTTSSSLWYSIWTSTDLKPRAGVRNGTDTNAVASTTVLNDDKWHFLTAVFESDTSRKIYVDGKLEGTDTTSVSYNANMNKVHIGNLNTCCTIEGKIDEAKIYDYARTPAQITWDYNRGRPIAHYKMNECQGIVIYNSADPATAGSDLNGTLNIGTSGTQTTPGTCSIGSTASAWSNAATGKINSAMSFDGSDDWISSGTSPSLKLQQNTLSAWINSNIFDVASDYNGIVEIDSGTSIKARLMTYGNIATIRYHPSYSDSTSSFVNINSLSTNTWYHIVGTWNGTTIKTYLNGQEVDSDPYSTTTTYTTTPHIQIGRNTNLNRYWDGLIDDVRIYNYALTSEQIKTLHNEGAINFNN